MELSVDIYICKTTCGIIKCMTLDMSEFGYVNIGKTTVNFNFDMPDENQITQIQVAALRDKKNKLSSEYFRESKAIDDEIQSLLALPSEI